MNTEIKPCPFCKGKSASIANFGDHWIQCQVCRTSGPTFKSEVEAIKHWNLRAPDQWQDISTAPRDGTVILAIQQGLYKPEVPFIPYAASFQNGTWKNHSTGFEGYFPSHWMPLPEPPKG